MFWLHVSDDTVRKLMPKALAEPFIPLSTTYISLPMMDSWPNINFQPVLSLHAQLAHVTVTPLLTPHPVARHVLHVCGALSKLSLSLERYMYFCRLRVARPRVRKQQPIHYSGRI